MQRQSHILARYALLALLLTTPVIVGCRDRGPAVPTQPASDDGLAEVVTSEHIQALGVLVPARQMQVSFIMAGVTDSVVAQVGTPVQAGDVLAALDATPLKYELQQARETVTLRQAELDGLSFGASDVLIQGAQATHDQQVAEAQIALQLAQLSREEGRAKAEAERQARQQAIALAQGQLERAETQLVQAQVQAPSADIVVAEVNLDRAKDALEMVQVEYDKAIHRDWEPPEVRDAYARALRAAEQDLQLAQAAFVAAQDALTAHELGVVDLTTQRDTAALQLTQTLSSKLVYSPTLAMLDVEVQRAELRLDGLQAWHNPQLDPAPATEIARAEAQLHQAVLAVEQLQWRLEATELLAPFDGVVSKVYFGAGEWASAGAPVVELLDTSRWLVQTRNVGELEIGRVRLGMQALVKVNAFQGQTLKGRVIRIAPDAVVQQGDTTYTLTIELEPTDLNLRPGMTTQIEVVTE
jgi:multidrug resistance efflux pump